MTVKTIDELVGECPVFAEIESDQLEFIAGCGQTARFIDGEYLFREGERAETFYVIRHGRVALDLHVPNRGVMTIETLEPCDVVGWSWLFPPYKWHFGARAVDLVRAIAFDGTCLRGKCDADPVLGYSLVNCFARVMLDRLESTRLRLVDVYGDVAR
jgi:CRP/FNR family transcriptional regulator, cyclic AMP receptor protein